MDRVYSSGAVASPPAAPLSPSSGYPTSGNPLAAVPATVPGPYWFHQITEEIRNVLVAAGITPDHEDLSQLAAAVQALATNGAGVAEMVAATITNKASTPGRQKYHPMHPKKIIRFPGSGSNGAVTPSINLGGTARVERVQSGWYRILFSTTGTDDDMASATYAAAFIVTDDDTAGVVGSWGAALGGVALSNIAGVAIVAQDATGMLIKCEGSASGAVRDPEHISLVVFGTLP